MQESFCAQFRNYYIGRNVDEKIVAGNIRLFAEFLKGIPMKSVLEIGANVGLYLTALRFLYRNMGLLAIEINGSAATQLSERLPDAHVEIASIVELRINTNSDRFLLKGVPIHISPELLSDAYRKMSQWGNSYDLFVEFCNPTPLAVPYRGHDDRLLKRDFAGEFLTANPEFYFKNCDFVYQKDSADPFDDITGCLKERIYV